MKILEVHVRGYRALRDVKIRLDDLTILVGSNSAGKSSLLKALKFFFEGDSLEQDDVFGRVEGGTATVQITFGDLSQADRDAFGVYALGDQMILSAIWSGGEVKWTGRGLRFSEFEPIRAAVGRDRTRLYRELREARSDLDLPEATRMDVVDNEMLAWEMQHPAQCETADQDAGRLFGYSSVGQSVIGQRFKFVFVPGVQDASEEAVERRGSILDRLLSAIAEQRAQANEELATLERETRLKYGEVVERAHGPTLRGLAQNLETHMQRYVPSAGIALQPVAPQLSVSPPGVELRGGEEQDFSDLGRQGHGFQRTFVIAALEYLAETAAAEGASGEDMPTLFLAIEEPELYQHPPRARHFFATLRSLASEAPNVQVAYATHSPYFVAAENFDNLRIFRRTPENGMPASVAVNHASIERVHERIPDIALPDLRRYVARTMAGSFPEAFFARSVLLVEGPTDAAVFIQASKLMEKEFAPLGVVCVTLSKSAFPTAMAVLAEFGIPSYAVFDGDGHTVDQEPCEACGREGHQRRGAAEAANRKLLSALGASEEGAFPETGARENWACFGDDLEQFMHEYCEGFSEMVGTVAREHDWRPKSPEAYAEALERCGVQAIPNEIRDVLVRLLDMAAQDRDSVALTSGTLAASES